MLRVDNLGCERGGRRLFAGVELVLPRGQWLHVQGDNGAGKTSFLRQLVGLLPHTSGSRVLWDEVALGGGDAEALHDKLHYLGHQPALKFDLSALENIIYAMKINGVSAEIKKTLEVLGSIGLRGREYLAVQKLSAGQKRRVLLAKLKLIPAPFWVLDEPLASLDVSACETLTGWMSEHLEQGGLLVVTSHQRLNLPANGQVLQLDRFA